MSETFTRLAGWTAYANGALTVANMVTLMLMFGVSLFWGRINDAISVVWILSFVPLALLLLLVNQHVAGRWVAIATAAVGIVAMLLFAWLQYLLVVGEVHFEQTLAPIMALGGLVGLWLLANGILALAGQTLPAGLAWLTIGFGLCYVLGAMAYWLGGYEQPVLWISVLVGYVIGPVWAFWLGRLLLQGRLIPGTVAAAAGS